MWASLYSRNIALYFFSLICSSFARKTYAKKQAFPGGVFLRSFVERETKQNLLFILTRKQRSVVLAAVVFLKINIDLDFCCIKILRQKNLDKFVIYPEPLPPRLQY